MSKSKNNYELITKDFALERMADYLFHDFHNKDCSIYIEQKIDFDENGHSDFWAEIRITPKEKIFHFPYLVSSQKPGKITINRFFVVGDREDFGYFGVKNDRHSKFFLFFGDHGKDSEFTIILDYRLENRLSDLIDKDLGFFQRKIQNKQAKTIGIDMTFRFPNIDKFENLQALITAHPQKNLVKTTLESNIKGGKKVFNLLFKNEDYSPLREGLELKFFFDSNSL